MGLKDLPAGCTLADIDAASSEDITDVQQEIDAAICVIHSCHSWSPDRSQVVLGALMGMLQGLTGEGQYCTHGPCFDEKTTKALRELIEAIS